MSAAAKTALLVDDDEFIHTMIGTYLQSLGYRVLAARNGMEALRLVRETIPDIVLTDVNMPELNGLELTKRLRAHHRTARLPILMFSDHASARDVLSGYAEGADEYLPKPFVLPILAAKMDSLLRRSQVDSAGAPPGKVILVLHAKGGAGATTLAVNVAASLSVALAAQVAVLDLNLEFGNAAVYLNLRPELTLADLSEAVGDGSTEMDDRTFEQFVATDATSQVRLVVGARLPERAELVSLPAIQMTIDRLRKLNDYVLVDTPPSFTERTLTALDASDLICVVTSPTVPALTSTKECLDVLRKLGIAAERVLLVLNRTTGQGASLGEAAAFFGRSPDVVIPRSDSFDHAANIGVPVVLSHPEDPAAKDLRALADRIGGVLQVQHQH